MTSEGESSTETWVEDKSAKFPYAYDSGGKLSRWFGVTGIPHAVLVDASGNIVYRGSPSGVSDALIEQALEGAIETPMWEWSKKASSVRKALVKRQLAKALAAAQKLSEDDGRVSIVAAIQSQIMGRVASIQSAKEGGDFKRVLELGDLYKKELAGLTEAEVVAEVVKSVKADKASMVVVKGQKKLADLEVEASELRKRDDANDLIESIQKLQKKHPGTIVETHGRALITKIRGMMERLR